MTYEIILITDSTRRTGFDLAGVAGVYESESRETTEHLIIDIMREKDVGIIIVADHVMPETDHFRYLQSKSFPTIVSIPISGLDKGSDTEKYLQEFIRRSIGISVKI